MSSSGINYQSLALFGVVTGLTSLGIKSVCSLSWRASVIGAAPVGFAAALAASVKQSADSTLALEPEKPEVQADTSTSSHNSVIEALSNRSHLDNVFMTETKKLSDVRSAILGAAGRPRTEVSPILVSGTEVRWIDRQSSDGNALYLQECERVLEDATAIAQLHSRGDGTTALGYLDLWLSLGVLSLYQGENLPIFGRQEHMLKVASIATLEVDRSYTSETPVLSINGQICTLRDVQQFSLGL